MINQHKHQCHLGETVVSCGRDCSFIRVALISLAVSRLISYLCARSLHNVVETFTSLDKLYESSISFS